MKLIATSVKVVGRTFINAFNGPFLFDEKGHHQKDANGEKVVANGGLALVIALPLALRNIIGSFDTKDGKDLYRSVLINLPADGHTAQYLDKHEALRRMYGKKFEVIVSVPEGAEIYETEPTASGNIYLTIPALTFEKNSIKEPVQLGSEEEVSEEFATWTANNQKRIQERVAKKAALVDDWS